METDTLHWVNGLSDTTACGIDTRYWDADRWRRQASGRHWFGFQHHTEPNSVCPKCAQAAGLTK